MALPDAIALCAEQGPSTRRENMVPFLIIDLKAAVTRGDNVGYCVLHY